MRSKRYRSLKPCPASPHIDKLADTGESSIRDLEVERGFRFNYIFPEQNHDLVGVCVDGAHLRHLEVVQYWRASFAPLVAYAALKLSADKWFKLR